MEGGGNPGHSYASLCVNFPSLCGIMSGWERDKRTRETRQEASAVVPVNNGGSWTRGIAVMMNKVDGLQTREEGE